MSSISKRKEILKEFNINDSELDKLLNYNTNNFDHKNIFSFNLSNTGDEQFVETWSNYQKDSNIKGAYHILKQKLIQLNFPIIEGISKNDNYQDATLRGQLISNNYTTQGFTLNDPDNVKLIIYIAPFGSLPMVIINDRKDFVSIIQALTKKNEPVNIPESMGASMISGYNNWDRIKTYKNNWLKSNDEKLWAQEFKNLINKKELYQDKFVILSTGPYSNVDANHLDINEDEWLNYSIKIRTAHEYAHYVTKRHLSSMKNNLLDELIADYLGITNAINEYRSEWFLKFMGINENAEFNLKGRFINYIPDEIKDENIIKVLSNLLFRASKNIEIFDKKISVDTNDKNLRYKAILAISFYTLEELSQENIINELLNSFNKMKNIIGQKEVNL